MRYAEALEYLFGRRRLGMKYGLPRMKALMRDLGSPQDAFRTIHVVGTNGKGSTTALLAETARLLGFRTGRNTSPHLLDFRERIAVDSAWIPPDSVTEFIRDKRGLIERHEATFFEITTSMAAWHFARTGVEWAVVEAGLGGRLDATRTFGGRCTVFTGVDIEHRRILGPTKSVIAGEKLAIAPRGTVLVCHRQHGPVERMVHDAVTARDLDRIVPSPTTLAPLPGDHQLSNAALALAAALSAFGRPAGEVQEAFALACRSLRWPGRLDLRRGKPDVLFDVSHNPQSVARLCEHLSALGRRSAGVVGFLADKPWRRMASMLLGYVDPVVATTPLSDRLLPAGRLDGEFRRLGFDSRPVDPVEAAVAAGRGLAPDLLVVAGSFYVVGDAMLSAWRNGWTEGPSGEESQILDTPPDAVAAGLH